MHPIAEKVTASIIKRSEATRKSYLDLMSQASGQAPDRSSLSCGNLAHGFAACESGDKSTIKMMDAVNIGIVTAYNDMLSAHQPYAAYPEKLKAYAREMGATAQVAGGVPAMCDGVTQGQTGMELSLFSRDNIAQATAVALSHQMFDAVICLGICDKIVPGLIIGTLRFGHLPVLFIPAGPMPSGLPNKEKVRIRQLYAEGKVGRKELLEAESASYHSAGTCTFYGTANSNQVVMEAMGLQLPGSSFVNPGTDLRDALTREAVHQTVRIAQRGDNFRPMYKVIDERSFVNAVVALLASGGSTNHTIHLIAMARAAGIILNWDDFDALSSVVPLLARVYPNGQADINHFQAAGGTGFLFHELINGGFMHADALTVSGASMQDYVKEPKLSQSESNKIDWHPGVTNSLDPEVLSSVAAPFDSEGGLRVLKGNLGRSVIKISAVATEHRYVSAPAVVLSSQHQLQDKFESGELNKDCIVVVRFQGPSANGMPELHKLMPPLGVLQDRGYKVALVTDGRMSGASGKVPAAIHLSPEALHGGVISKIQDGDLITLDAEGGSLHLHVSDTELAARESGAATEQTAFGVGRELFAGFKDNVTSAEQGATPLFPPLESLGSI
jgi:phosphogluconate dehydratase